MKYNNILSFRLFELATAIEPDYFEIDEKDIRGYNLKDILFVDNDVEYIMSILKIPYKDSSYGYITFSTKEQKEEAAKIKNYKKSDELYSSNTDKEKSFSVLSKIVWLVKHLGYEYVGYATTNKKRNKIFDYYIKQHGVYVEHTTHQISPKEIGVYKINSICDECDEL